MAAAEAETRKPWSMKRVVAASSAGTAFEWYDFFIFGSLATTIQKVFFAGLDPTAGLIAALGLFAAGFAFRPLGAIIFGVIGDRLGRKGAFLATVSLMGGATFLIGVLPTYAAAGIISPILLILLRILQGIALGGEYGGAAIYVAEHAPNNRRGDDDRLDPDHRLARSHCRTARHSRHADGGRRGGLPRMGLARSVPRLGRAADHLGLAALQAVGKPGISQAEGGRRHQPTRRCARLSASGTISSAC